MKLSKLWASALALLALTACGKDLEPSSQSIVSEAPSTQEVYASLSAGQDQESLRVLYNLTGDDSGATSGLSMAEKDLMIRVAIKRGTGVPTYQDLTFKKVKGENKAIYEGPITVPTDGSGDYQLSAVLLHEVGGLTFAKANTNDKTLGYPHVVNINATPKALRLASGNQIQANVPYLSAWQSVALDASGTKLAPTAIKFKPQGTLLRFRIKNETDQAYSIKQVNFMSRAMSPAAALYFHQLSPVDPSFPRIRPMSLYPPYAYTLPTSHQTIAAKSGDQPSKSPWFYIWVIPMDGNQVHSTVVDLITTSGAKLENVFSTAEPLPWGSVPVTFTIRNSGHTGTFENVGEVPNEWGSAYRPSKLALDYVSEYDFDNNEVNRGFVEHHEFAADNIGRFTWSDAVAKFSTPVVIKGKKYSLPTVAEMHSVFPLRYLDRKDGEGGSPTLFSSNSYDNVLEKEVKLGDLIKNYYADYRGSSTVTYAVRFKDNTNLNRTAFKYEIEETSSQYRVIVTCRYLGNSLVSINDVAQPAFWQTNATKDVSRTFVSRGIIDVNPVAEFTTEWTNWWTSGDISYSGANSLLLYWKRSGIESTHKLSQCMVRPWIRD